MKRWMKRIAAGAMAAVLAIGQGDCRGIAMAADTTEDWQEVWETENEPAEFRIEESAEEESSQETADREAVSAEEGSSDEAVSAEEGTSDETVPVEESTSDGAASAEDVIEPEDAPAVEENPGTDTSEDPADVSRCS